MWVRNQRVKEALLDFMFEKGESVFYILLQVLVFINLISSAMLLHVFENMLNSKVWGRCFFNNSLK